MQLLPLKIYARLNSDTDKGNFECDVEPTGMKFILNSINIGISLK
jgi:hypothetical protein